MADSRHLKVLMLEDNPADVDLIKDILEEESIEKQGGSVQFEFFSFRKVQEAIGFCSTQSVDLALLDLHVLDSHGLETLETFRRSAPTVPIIVLTGLEDKTLKEWALGLGAVDYIGKAKGLENQRLLERLVRASMAQH